MTEKEQITTPKARKIKSASRLSLQTAVPQLPTWGASKLRPYKSVFTVAVSAL